MGDAVDGVDGVDVGVGVMGWVWLMRWVGDGVGDVRGCEGVRGWGRCEGVEDMMGDVEDMMGWEMWWFFIWIDIDR